MKSGISYSQNYDAVCVDARDAVMALRRVGIKTVCAIYEVAKAVGVKESRIRRLFFGEGDAKVCNAERRQVRAAVILLHRDLAKKHRALAAANEAIAYAKEAESYPQLQEFVHVCDFSIEGAASRSQA